MGEQGAALSSYLPLVIFGAVMVWRLRSMRRARPLRVTMLWVMPAIVSLLAGFAVYGIRPGLTGWLAMTGGSFVGAGLGWQRARLMRLQMEGEGTAARVMIRQSPAALLLIVAVAVLRRLLLPGFHPGTGHPGSGGFLAMDALLGFAVGMICIQRLVLWHRARALSAGHAALFGAERDVP